MMKAAILSFAVLMLAGCVALGATSGRVAVKAESSTSSPQSADGATTVAGFGERDRAAIQGYYRGRKLTGGQKLPAGFRRYDKLPAGLTGEPLPRELETRLAQIPGHYQRLRIGRDIVLVNRNTRTAADIVFGVGY